MRLGVIDLGTNSVRFNIHSLGPSRKPKLLHQEKMMIRLGQGVFLQGKLDPQAIRRAIQAFRSFRQTASLFHAERIIAFGTSAMREATDSEEFINLVRKEAQIDIRVISGEEEAQLIALGILSHEKSLKGRFGLVDIGGGSTEISICRGKTLIHSASFPLGTARLQQVFLRTSPPKVIPGTDLDPVLALRRYIRNSLLPKMITEEWPKIPRIIGSSGTIRALERILKRTAADGATNRRNLEKFIKSIRKMNQNELLQVPGMEARRVDMILAGAVLLEECMSSLGAQEFTTTNYSLRDGILDREINNRRQEGASEAAFRLEDLYNKTQKLGYNLKPIHQSLHLCDSIFDDTERLHQLKSKWKRYLSAAAILHNIGQVINPTHHEAHSYYIVKHSDFPGMESWEAEFIARLCLMHNRGSPSKKDLSFTKEKVKRSAFIRLLALLRVINALDRGTQSNITLQKVQLTRTRVILRLAGKSSVDLEILRLEQKKALFEKVFKRPIMIEKTET